MIFQDRKITKEMLSPFLKKKWSFILPNIFTTLMIVWLFGGIGFFPRSQYVEETARCVTSMNDYSFDCLRTFPNIFFYTILLPGILLLQIFPKSIRLFSGSPFPIMGPVLVSFIFYGLLGKLLDKKRENKIKAL